MMEKKHKGAHNELLATVWLLKQGYEVFRNVSAHGNVDIIAMRGGKITLFDVKKAQTRADGSTGHILLKQEQVDLGVELLCVTDNGSCEIFSAPIAKLGTRKCARCERVFQKNRVEQKFCSDKCRVAVSNEAMRLERIAATVKNI